jgi:hypothetical protein
MKNKIKIFLKATAKLYINIPLIFSTFIIHLIINNIIYYYKDNYNVDCFLELMIIPIIILHLIYIYILEFKRIEEEGMNALREIIE